MTYENDIFSSLKRTNDTVIVGIDEAGRGPVMGYMVYCAMIFHKNSRSDLKFSDSKVLSDKKRRYLFGQMTSENYEFIYYALHPYYITTKMHTGEENLNQISINAVCEIIGTIKDHYQNIETVYVDALGNCANYKKLLTDKFNLNFIIESKADSKYQVVSAASIVAKVVRDLKMDEFGKDTGSGYPSDPITKKWIQKHKNLVFGFPSGVRYTWETIKKILGKRVSPKFTEPIFMDKEELKVEEFLNKLGKRQYLIENLENYINQSNFKKDIEECVKNRLVNKKIEDITAEEIYNILYDFISSNLPTQIQEKLYFDIRKVIDENYDSFNDEE